ncbi:MAG TPA: hypothetical protein VGE01_02700, partial [Fimbriimonas sp.]
MNEEQSIDASTALLEQFANREYEHGWSVDIETDQLEPGLSEDTIRRLSAKKEEPEWMLEWRLKAYRHFLTMKEPNWPNVHYEKPDLQAISYYSAPKMKPVLNSLDEADPEILRTFQKLGIPVEEQKVLLNVKGAAASAADARTASQGTGPMGAITDAALESGGPGPSTIAVDAVFDSVSVVTTFKEELKKHG